MGETALDEERDAEEQGKEFAAIGEGDRNGHDDAAADREQSAVDCAVGEAFADDNLCGL